MNFDNWYRAVLQKLYISVTSVHVMNHDTEPTDKIRLQRIRPNCSSSLTGKAIIKVLPNMLRIIKAKISYVGSSTQNSKPIIHAACQPGVFLAKVLRHRLCADFTTIKFNQFCENLPKAQKVHDHDIHIETVHIQKTTYFSKMQPTENSMVYKYTQIITSQKNRSSTKLPTLLF